ncbi:MAG: DUF4231 domain-containing protein [Rhizonema sp. PD38]|nr:DUF4231 domain-containing protein [Rhizonema sp. PD38]
MDKKNDYSQYLKQTFSGLIDRLDLSDLQKDFMKNRWLDQVMWLEGQSTKVRNRYYRLRMITIVGGVIVPALIGFQKGSQKFQEIVSWSALGLSQVVAVSAAVEEFFGYGDKYRSYRNTAEGLKIEGWQFFQMAGSYHQYHTHSDAYTTFADRVEQYIQQDLQGFVSQLAGRQEESKKQTKETATQNIEHALSKLNEQLQLQAESQAQLKQLVTEKQHPEASSQQLEQNRSNPQQSDDEKPAEQAAQVTSDKQPDSSPVGNLWQQDEENRDSTSLNVGSVEYLSANEILAKIKSNPISRNGRAPNKLIEAKQASTRLPVCGVELIKEFEGCYLDAYPDPLTNAEPITIGWGSTKKRDGSPWQLGERISQQVADELLMYQLETSYLPDLEKIPCWNDLNRNQQGALLSFGYNLGSKFYGTSNFGTMTKVLKNRDWDNIRETFIMYRNPGSNVEEGLRRRRVAEAELFLKPYS